MKGPKRGSGKKYANGAPFGRLVVHAYIDVKTRLCLCRCGVFTRVRIYNLGSGSVQSCGCLLLERRAEASVTHGYARKGKVHTTYRIWQDMRKRCLNPASRAYHNYGGRGITIDPSWDTFEQFLADMGERPPGLTLERTNVNGPYCATNCIWATRKDQANNTRRNRLLSDGERTQTASMWAEELGTKAHTLLARIDRGWSEKEALTTPIRAITLQEKPHGVM